MNSKKDKEAQPKKGELRIMNLSELTPANYNPRKVEKDALIRLAKSIDKFGNLQPVVFNLQTKTLIAGHQRVKCMTALSRKQTEVWCVDLDPKSEKLALIALNKSAGEWDLPMLKDLLLQIDSGEDDMDLTGFSEDEIGDLMTQFHVEPEPEGELDALLSKFELIVECDDEIHRKNIFDKLTEQGLACRLVKT